MQKEIDSAVQFICGLLQARSLSLNLVETFRTVLCQVMYGRYKDHWFPDKPCKGSAYRCMCINDRNLDPLILKAGLESGLTATQLLQLLPNQLTVWVDPEEVAYRIGEDGSIGVLYAAKAPASSPSDEDFSDISTSEASSDCSSTKSSPSHSPVPSSTDDDVATLPSPRVYGSCRLEMSQQQSKQQRALSARNGIKTPAGGSGSVASGEQYLNSVLIAS
jgi:protein Tob/BTG